MGDAVQQLLEEMVPELEDLEKKEIFNHAEIRTIVKRRRQFEYLLKRRAPEQIDYLRYLQYEVNLETLRKNRKRKLGLKKKSLSDFAGLRRIHFVFERALRKFKGDVKLWLQYIDFCLKTDSSKILSKVFARALQFHPTKASFWILSASWEFDKNSNVTGARSLLQRSLRVNPSVEQLWHEYFKLELMFVKKVTERRRVLGLDGSTSKQSAQSDSLKIHGEDEDDEEEEEEEEEEASTTGEPQQQDGDVTISEIDKTAMEAKDAFFACAIPKVVFKNATKNIPNNSEFRIKFLNICFLFSDLDTESLKDLIYDSLLNDFPTDADSRYMWSVRPLDQARSKSSSVADMENALRECFTRFDQALTSLPSEQMFDRYIRFLSDQIGRYESGTVPSFLQEQHEQICERAHSATAASAFAYTDWINSLLRTGKPDAAINVSEWAVTNLPNNGQLWSLRVELLAKDIALKPLTNITDMEKSRRELAKTTLAALRHVPRSESSQLRFTLLGLLNQIPSEDDRIESLFKDSIQNDITAKETFKVLFIDWALIKHGISKARVVYQTVLQMLPVSVDIFSHCIAVERSQTVINMDLTRSLFERALMAHGVTDTSLWLEYIHFEKDQKQFDRCQNIYFRATKQLKDATEFMKGYDLQQEMLA